MPRFTKKNPSVLIGIIESVAPLIIDGARYAYTRMRHAETLKNLKATPPVSPVSDQKSTKKVESS